MGEAGHGNGLLSLVSVASGQRDPQQGGSTLGILAEKLVEIAHPKEQERVRVAGLELAILLHHRCRRRLAHER